MATVAVLNTDAGLSGKTIDLLESAQTITGVKTFSLSPAAPFAVTAGSAKVSNLDVDKVDGVDVVAANGNRILVSTAANAVGEAAALTNGQVLIGSTGAAPAAAAITAGAGITVTNGAGSISIAATGGVLNKSTTEQDVTNTVAATDVYSYSVPGGTLATTGVLRLTANGSIDNASGGGVNITIAVTYGATTLYSAAVTTVANAAAKLSWELETLINANGATGSQRAHTKIVLGANGANTDNSNQAASSHLTSVHSALAEDSTAAKNLKITVTWASAAATLHFRRYLAMTEGL